MEQNYCIKRFYEGRQTVTEALTEIIADRVRKKLKKDFPNKFLLVSIMGRDDEEWKYLAEESEKAYALTLQ